jgi:hypothetical protein
VVGVGDVELEDVGLGREPPGHALREAHGSAERGEDDLRPLLLGAAGDREGDGGVGQHTGDEDALTFEEHRGSP